MLGSQPGQARPVGGSPAFNKPANGHGAGRTAATCKALASLLGAPGYKDIAQAVLSICLSIYTVCFALQPHCDCSW